MINDLRNKNQKLLSDMENEKILIDNAKTHINDEKTQYTIGIEQSHNLKIDLQIIEIFEFIFFILILLLIVLGVCSCIKG